MGSDTTRSRHRAGESRSEDDRADDEHSQASGGAAEGHCRPRLDCPEGELGDGHEPGREESRSGIETLADEGCAVADAEQRETYRQHRSPPEYEAAGDEGQPGEHTHRRRAVMLARGQPNGEREEGRAHRGRNAGR